MRETLAAWGDADIVRPLSGGTAMPSPRSGLTGGDWWRAGHAADWPQRPGLRSTTELVTANAGADVDLAAMPADAVADCRRAWAALAGTPMAVVHGDPGPANIRILPREPGCWTGTRPGVTTPILTSWNCRAHCCRLPGRPLPAEPRPRGKPRTGGWSSRLTRAGNWPRCARCANRLPRQRETGGAPCPSSGRASGVAARARPAHTASPDSQLTRGRCPCASSRRLPKRR